MSAGKLEAADAASHDFGVGDLADVTSACDLTTWIVIELLEVDGTPVAGEPYAIDLPNGETRTGKLDGNGRATVQGLDPGIARVRFPERDERDFGPMPHMPRAREALPWLEIELVDADGTGIAGEPYAVELPDGSRRQGTLDDDGRARLEGIEEGDCKVTFPRREGDDVEPIGTVGEPARA